MKTTYYILIGLEAFLLLATIVVSLTLPVVFADFWQVFLCLIIGVPAITGCLMALERSHRPLQHIEEPCASDTVVGELEQLLQAQPEDSVAEKEPSVQQQWSHAMYLRYNGRWNDVFQNIKYPMTAKDAADISLLLWEISSKTMDFLLTDNNDINKLKRNSDSVEAIIGNLPEESLEQKAYYRDPTTVPARAIGIADWLEAQGVTAETTAFGYRINLKPQSDEL